MPRADAIARPRKRSGSRPERKGSPRVAPGVVKVVLDNGLTVLVKEVHSASVLNLAVWVRVGSVNEDERIAGISHYIEHMLFKGTRKRKVGEIAREIHSVGGYLNAFTHFECTCYWVVLPSRFLDVALDVQSDALTDPLFDPEELVKERKVIIEELKMYEDRPESYCFEKLMGLAFRRHHYGRPIIGYERTLTQIGRDDIVDYYRSYYHPGNMVVTLVGDVDRDRAVERIATAFGRLAPAPLTARHSLPEPTQTRFRKLECRGEIQRAHIQLAFHIPGALHDDLPACRVLGAILGEGRSSRLFRSLRERRRVVDSVEAGVFAERDPGLLYMGGVLDGRKIPEMEKLLWEELDRVRRRRPPEEEIRKAKHMLECYHIFSQETVEGQGRTLGFYENLGDYSLGENYVERLARVTAEDLDRVADRYLRRENCSMAVYLPGKRRGT